MVDTNQIMEKISLKKVKKFMDVITLVFVVGIIVSMKVNSWRWATGLMLFYVGASQVSTVLGVKIEQI